VGGWAAVLAGHRHASHPSPVIGTAAGGSIIACVDARLMERPGLVARLGAPPDATDADLVALAYQRWGQRCPEHLDGAFAFAVADLDAGGLLLARDHKGDRPLVIHRRDGVVAFASNALTLTGFPGVGHELDTERMLEILVLAYASHRTVVRGVQWVKPGTCTWIQGDRERSWRWWRPDEIERRDLGSLDAHAQELRDALDDAVARSIQGAHHPGSFLSGGLDSASVVAMLARQRAPEVVRTYTSVPPVGWDGPLRPGWIPDERFAVEALHKRYPTLRPTYFESRGIGLFDHHESIWELGGGPARNPTNMTWLLGIQREAAADGVDLLLTGGVGNMAFSADGPGWLWDLARHGRVAETVREVRAWTATNPDVSSWTTLRRSLLSPIQPTTLRRWRARQQPDPIAQWLRACAIHPDQLDEFDVASALPRVAEPDSGGFTRDLRNLFEVGATQADATHAYGTRWGVEMTDPTGDRRLLETAFAQPERWRRHRGTSRAIARRAMADLLPTEIAHRRTRGAQVPDWFDRLSDQREMLTAEFEQTRDHPTARQLIDIGRLERSLSAWPAEHDPARAAEDERNLHLALTRALLVGRYVRWFESRAQRVAAGGPAVAVPEPQC
jgi:asparagine synthase (glutamine-hydrolysing)